MQENWRSMIAVSALGGSAALLLLIPEVFAIFGARDEWFRIPDYLLPRWMGCVVALIVGILLTLLIVALIRKWGPDAGRRPVIACVLLSSAASAAPLALWINIVGHAVVPTSGLGIISSGIGLLIPILAAVAWLWLFGAANASRIRGRLAPRGAQK
ncbi:hypothetical protein [Microbacterium sp. NPDC057650]|uniref:hypothetical protein n=1 Tax=unclassified Microbacterium TaxID=2609290 RepID=UPI0036724A32